MPLTPATLQKTDRFSHKPLAEYGAPNAQGTNISPPRITEYSAESMRSPITQGIALLETHDQSLTNSSKLMGHSSTTATVSAHNASPEAPNARTAVPTSAYSQAQLNDARAQFELLKERPFKLPTAYAWFETHAEFIFDGNLTLDALDEAHRQALSDFTEQLRTAALYCFGLIDSTSAPLMTAQAFCASEQPGDGQQSLPRLEQLLQVGKNPEHLIGDLLGLQLLHEDGLLGQLEFEKPDDFRRFGRVYTLAKNLYAAVDPEDEYTRLTDAYHPKNVINHLQDKSDIALLTAAAFHDFERYVPGIRIGKLACSKLDETIRKQALHPLNSAKLAHHLLQKSPLTAQERGEVYALICSHDAGPDGLTLEGFQYVPQLSGKLRDKLTDLTNADTAAFFDFSPMQDPTVEVFVKSRINTVLEQSIINLLPTGETLSEQTRDQLANLALTQFVSGLRPLDLTRALDSHAAALITDLTSVNETLGMELEKLSARVTKHAKRISTNMLERVAVLHAQRPRTQVDALIHAALQKYDNMDRNLKSLKHVALAVIATQRLTKNNYLKKSLEK